MSVVKIPKLVGLIEVSACAKCGKAHGQCIVADRGQGPYFICRTTIHSIPTGDAELLPLPEGFEIEEWVPQQMMIGTVADLASIAGSRKTTIERLDKKVADLTAAQTTLALSLVQETPAAEPKPFFWTDCTPEEYAAILAAFEPLKQAHKWPIEKAFKDILSRFKAATPTPVATAEGGGAEDEVQYQVQCRRHGEEHWYDVRDGRFLKEEHAYARMSQVAFSWKNFDHRMLRITIATQVHATTPKARPSHD